MSRVAIPIAVLPPRLVPLGGPRAMTVRRTLPHRGRTTIGAWCFVDHYGPDDVASTGGMVVPTHPHAGLQTLTWLFEGEVEHRDSAGGHVLVRPGELNLMTAGRGISHSEVSTARTIRLHGVQLWLALPDRDRHAAPALQHVATPALDDGGLVIRVFAGALLGETCSAATFSPVVAAQLVLAQSFSRQGAVELPIEPGFEHGLLVDAGELTMATSVGEVVVVRPGELAYLPPGVATIRLTATGGGPARVVLLGGEPLGERLLMWWNFVARDHDEIVQFRDEWQATVAALGAGKVAVLGRFGAVLGEPLPPIPAPALPAVRLLPRP